MLSYNCNNKKIKNLLYKGECIMALIKCRECGKQISDKAKTCPHCGVKNSSGMSTKKKNIIITCSLIVIVVVVAMILIFKKGPLDVYKSTMIDALEEYRVGKIDRKELRNKMDSISSKLNDYDRNEKDSFKALSISVEAGYISMKLLSDDASNKQINEWIAEIKDIN